MSNINSQPPNSEQLFHEPVTGASVADGLCPGCRYELKGLPERGACPECGHQYTPSTMHPATRLPSALELCLRFGWPLILEAIFGLSMLSNAGDNLVCAFLGCFALIPINSVVQAMLITRFSDSPVWNQRPFRERLRVIGTFAAVAFYVTLIGPFVIFGGCVIAVLVSLQGSLH